MGEKPQRPSVVVGMVMFPRFTQLDLTGPYEVFSSAPDTEVHLLSSSLEPVRTEWGLEIVPTTRYAEAPAWTCSSCRAGPFIPLGRFSGLVVSGIAGHTAQGRRT